MSGSDLSAEQRQGDAAQQEITKQGRSWLAAFAHQKQSVARTCIHNPGADTAAAAAAALEERLVWGSGAAMPWLLQLVGVMNSGQHCCTKGSNSCTSLCMRPSCGPRFLLYRRRVLMTAPASSAAGQPYLEQARAEGQGACAVAKVRQETGAPLTQPGNRAT